MEEEPIPPQGYFYAGIFRKLIGESETSETEGGFWALQSSQRQRQ